MFRETVDKDLLFRLKTLRGELAEAAQLVYNDWSQDPEGIDEVYGAGGICDAIADAITDRIVSLLDVQVTHGGQPGDDHSWAVISGKKKAYGIDIPCRLYESGGGYRWKKKEGVVFKPEDIEIFEVPYPEEGFDMGHSEGGTNLRGNRFEADLALNKSRADIKDRKNSKLFLLLSREDLQELHELTGELLRSMGHE